MIEYYLLFALSGGITSAIVTFLPIIKELEGINKEKYITHTFIENKKTSFIVWVLMASVVLPLIILSIFSEKENSKFIKSVLKHKG